MSIHPHFQSLKRKANCLLAGSSMSGNVHVQLCEKGGGQKWRCCTSLSSSMGSALFFGRVCQYDLNEGGADIPARITGDSYKNGWEVNSTRRHSRMGVDLSGRDNNSGLGRSGDHSQEQKRLNR
ncbi:hypothetical protein RND71_005652 [Anisodus tanguticus]|uniref:Uncharacterized protein n=1 Tax=Anisodus tanguticus TaxID=243964 RepID=A0AAE1SSF9_9SOLA|nr:hypothetical protein RND71_005652 [Anisodus tanguticus]